MPGLYELHCHAYGSVPAEKVLERLAEIGPNMADFARRHHEAYGHVPDLKGALEAYRRGEADALERFKDIYILKNDGGDRWARFQAKYNILTATSAFRKQPRNGPLIPAVIDELNWLIDSLVPGWIAQGIVHCEVRFMLPGKLSQGQARQCLLHLLDRCRKASDSSFNLDLVVSVHRRDPMRHWPAIEKVLLEHERGDHLVGIDLCHNEQSVSLSQLKTFADHLHAFNAAQPKRALALLIHVGEQIAGRSIEAHIRHVYEAQTLGAHRLGHALIAGIDIPALGPHVRHETSEQRLDQLAWEQRHGLGSAKESASEEQRLCALPAGSTISLDYDQDALWRCHERQAWLLTWLSQQKTLIECCPSSNRLLLGLKNDDEHPVSRLLDHGLGVILGSDDGGVLGCALSDEYDWLARQTGQASAAIPQCTSRELTRP